MATPTQVININNISEYLAANSVSNGVLFGAYIDPRLPLMLYMEGRALIWGNQYSAAKLQSVANYVYALDGRFGAIAQGIISRGGGGTVTPIVPISTPDAIEFVVSGSSPITTGNSNLTISSFIGFNLIFVRNNIPQSTINTGGTYYTWSKTTGIFSCIGAASDTELFQFYPTA